MLRIARRFVFAASGGITRPSSSGSRHCRHAAGKFFAAIMFLLYLMRPAFAMDPGLPPPPFDSVSDKLGMNLTTGLWKLYGPSVHIGPQGRGGLSWTYPFNGGSYLDLGAYQSVIKYFYTDSNHVYVTVLEKNEEFYFDGSKWNSATGGGTLTQSGGNWTYTDVNGTVTQFTGISPIGAAWFTEAIASTTTYSDGLALTYTWRSSSTTGGLEISSVNNNLGYQIKFNFDCNTPSMGCYTKVVGVVALNNAIEYCDPAAQNCSLSNSWPSLSWTVYSPSFSYYSITLNDTLSHTWTYVGAVTTVYTPSPHYHIVATVTWPTGQTIVNEMDQDLSTLEYYNRTATDGLHTWTYSITDNMDGTVTGCSYDPNSVLRCVLSDQTTGNPITDTLDPSGIASTKSYGYISAGQPGSITERNGDYSQFGYTGTGVLNYEKQTGTGKSLSTTATFGTSCNGSNYKYCNKPTAITDGNGNTTDYTYDTSSGNVATAEGPAVNGVRPLTTYSYTALYAWYKNSAGTIVQASTPVYMLTGGSTCMNSTSSCSGTADERKTTLTYESGGSGTASNLQNLTVTNQAGNASCPSATCATVTSSYDMFGNVASTSVVNSTSDKTVYFYDGDQRPVGSVQPLSGGGGTANYAATKVTYDDSNRVTKVEQGYVPGQSRTAFDNSFTSLVETQTAYDAHTGLRMQVTGSVGNTAQSITQYAYDAGQRPLCTAIRQNLSGLPSDACTQSSGNKDLITQNNYDLANRVTSVDTGVGSGAAIAALTNHYDTTGRIDWVEDGKGYRSGYGYDGNNRLDHLYFPSASSAHTIDTSDYEAYGYDNFGNLTSKRLRSGGTFTMAYDALERLSRRQDPSSSSNDIYYTYDLVGDVLGIGYGSPSAPALSFTWDALGRKLSETSYGHTLSSQYDAAGNRTRLTYSDGNYIAYSYDLLNRMYRVQENGGTVLAQYAYDDLGRVTGISRSNGAATTASYGASSQSWSLTQDLASSGLDVTFGMDYSAAGQLSDRSISNSAYRYSVGASATTNYSPNGLNQYATVGGTTYSYDARGNLTSDGSRNFSYDNGNELTGVSGSATMTLAYDPAGRLRQTVTPGGGAGTPTNWGAANWGAFQWSGATYVTENYVYDGDALAVEYDDAGNIVRRYVPGAGPDQTLAWYEGSGMSTTYWLHTDEQGSVIATSDGSGNGTAYAYSATGEPTAWGTPGSVPAFRYTGQMALPQVQLMYYKARMYDPALGRFLQTDPAGYSQGLNLYAYVANNYPNATDPSGMLPCSPGPNDSIETIITCVDSGYCDFMCQASLYGHDMRVILASIVDSAPRDVKPTPQDTNQNQQMCPNPKSWNGSVADVLEDVGGGLALGALAVGGAALIPSVGSIVAAGTVTVAGAAEILGGASTAAIVGATAFNVRDQRWGNVSVDVFSLGLGRLTKISATALPKGMRLAQDAYAELMGRAATSVCTGK